jgi:hypothetical protein
MKCTVAQIKSEVNLYTGITKYGILTNYPTNRQANQFSIL